MDLDKRKELAHYIATNAGSLITDLFHGQIDSEEKSKNDHVTELDHSIEAMAHKCVTEQFPDDGFYGEEDSRKKSKNGYEWLVDPIDGTNNYLRGLPLCGFQLAILKDGKTIYALIHRPFTQEVYEATKDGGAHYRNDMNGIKRKLKVAHRPLDKAIGVFDAKVGKSGNQSTAMMLKLADKINMIRVFGAAVFDLPAVAEGSVDFLVTGIAKKYDIAAGILLIEEAGGIAFTPEGKEASIDDEVVIFCSPSLKDVLFSSI